MKSLGKSNKKVWALGLVVLLVSCGSPAEVEPARVASGGQGVSAASSPVESSPPSQVVGDGPAEQAIAGTASSIPVPDPEIGSEVHDLEIPLPDGASVARGVAFYRPGPMSGSVVGGVAVVLDDSPAVRGADGGVADVDAIAQNVNPELDPEVAKIGQRTVLGWPDSEVVPAEGIPQEDRSVSRYVIVLDEGIAMVTFDDVPSALAYEYLVAVVGAL